MIYLEVPQLEEEKSNFQQEICPFLGGNSLEFGW